MNVANTTICVFGGTGFIGRQIVRELAAKGFRIKVAGRVPERAFDLKPCGAVGQIAAVACNPNEEDSVRAAIKDCEAVINCIGILYEKGKSARFDKVHTDLPGMIARLCVQENVQRFIHISALGVDKASSKYAKSKLAGETTILKEFPKATILRPSVVFGPGDNFFNMFAKMAVIAPAMPLIGGGKTKFQPVYVGDVADAVMAALMQPNVGEDNPQGKIYELGGPDIVTFKEIYERLFKETGRTKKLINLPWGVASFQGALMNVFLPKPPLTADQVCSLKTDNVVSEEALTLKDLGLAPTAMSTILPTYLARFKPGGRFHGKKVAGNAA